MNTNLVFRALREEDAAAYWALRMEAVLAEPFTFGQSAEDLRRTTADTIAAAIAAKDAVLYGALEGAALVGIARFVREQSEKERHKGHVHGLYVAPTHRRRGVARGMIATIIDAMREDSSFEHLLLGVSTRNASARALYTSLGFIGYGIEPRSMKVGSEYVDEEQMVLFLR